jgi:hypothetical protein
VVSVVAGTDDVLDGGGTVVVDAGTVVVVGGGGGAGVGVVGTATGPSVGGGAGGVHGTATGPSGAVAGLGAVVAVGGSAGSVAGAEGIVTPPPATATGPVSGGRLDARANTYDPGVRAQLMPPGCTPPLNHVSAFVNARQRSTSSAKLGW